MGAIYTCGCGDTDVFVQDAFKLLFPNQAMPPISHSPQNCEFAKWAPYLKAADHAKQKYAYYLTDTEMWDLLKGVQIA